VFLDRSDAAEQVIDLLGEKATAPALVLPSERALAMAALALCASTGSMATSSPASPRMNPIAT
jgi:hypothetical protein